MLTLAHGPDFATVAALGYVLALPGVAVYGVALLWALGRAKWKRKVWGILALLWAAVFPLAFLLLLQQSGMVEINEYLWFTAVIAVCSVVSAFLLCMVTGARGPAVACAGGFVLTGFSFWLGGVGDWAFSGGPTSPLAFSFLAVVWVAPVALALGLWGRKVGKRKGSLTDCAACGYDLCGTAGAVCPECGTEVKRGR